MTDGNFEIFDGAARRAAAAAGIGTWRWNPATGDVELSDDAVLLLGSREPASSDFAKIVALVHQDDRAEVEAALLAGAKSMTGFDLHFRTANRAAAARAVRVRGRVIAGPDGTREATGIVIEAAHRRSDEVANSRLAAIVNSSDDAIIGKTLNGIVTDWNRGAEFIFGYTAAEMIGQPIAVLLPPDHADETFNILDKIKRGERVEHYETRRRRKDGTIIDVSITVSPVWDDAGKLFAASKVARDVTASKQSQAVLLERATVQQQLHDLQAELVHMSRFTAMGEMASTLAHELNQPLTAVAGYLRGIRRLLGAPETMDMALLRDAADRAAEQTLRAGQIIRRLREFVARGESERQAENLVKLIEEARTLALIGVKETGVLTELLLAPEKIFVLVDKIQIQQVILNLVRNAIEAMQDMKVRRLTISMSRAGGDIVEVAVADTGPGISPEIAAKLFQPFNTTKPQGMGLGLSISRTIIEAHNGQLWAAPNAGGGTVFRFTLRMLGVEELADET